VRAGRLRRAGLAAALLLGLLAAGTAAAAPRLSVAPLPGARPPLLKQLGVELCRAFECVAFVRGSTRAGFDLARMRQARADGILVGALSSIGASRILSLSLYTDTDFAELTWRVPLDARGAIPAEEFANLQRELSTRLGPPPPVPPPSPQAAVPQRSPAPPRVIEVPLPPPPVLVPRPPAAEPRGAPARPASASATPAPHPWLAAEVAGLLGRRSLRFLGAVAGPAPLRGHEAPRFGAAAARLELYPAARSGLPLLAGLGLFGAYQRSLGLETTVDGAPRDTALWQLSAGALWRSAPSGAGRLSVRGALSYEAARATVRPAVAGLPDVATSGLRAGLGLDAPLGGPAIALLEGGATRWRTARDLIGGPYFPGGSAWALDLEAGLGWALGDRLQLRLTGRWSMTRYDVDPHPEGIYRASGARDDQLTGSLSFRVAP